MVDALVGRESDGLGLRAVAVFTQHNGVSERDGGRRLRAPNFTLQFLAPYRSRREMHEANEFFEVQDHAAPSRPSCDHVVLMAALWIPIIFKRNQFITSGF